MHVSAPMQSKFSVITTNTHSVLKSQKKSHSTLRAKRAHILSGQKFMKSAKMDNLARKPEACGQTVLPDRSDTDIIHGIAFRKAIGRKWPGP